MRINRKNTDKRVFTQSVYVLSSSDLTIGNIILLSHMLLARSVAALIGASGVHRIEDKCSDNDHWKWMLNISIFEWGSDVGILYPLIFE